MKRILFSALLLSPWVLAQPAAAQVPPSVRLSPSQIQRISGGLYRFDSQDFFKRGQQRLEAEVQLLTQRRQLLTEGVLKIDQEILKQPDFSQFERPPGLPSDAKPQ